MTSTTRQESDRGLQENVMRELQREPRVNAAEIGVAAGDGAVTLMGSVATYTEKIEAVKAAERVRDVIAVADEIEVTLSHAHERDESEIAKAASRALRWNNLVPSTVEAEVANTFLVLRGEVEWQYQRDAAYRAVRDLVGVSGVSNQITIKPPIEEHQVDQRIADAFERNARLDAREITVTASGGTACLTGRVHSLQERRIAAKAAGSAPGVTAVDDRLVVLP